MHQVSRIARRHGTRVAIESIAGAYEQAGLAVEIPKAFPTSVETGLFINNEFVKAKSGLSYKTEDPATGQVIAEVQEAGAEDVDIAVAAARHAFEKGDWSRTGGHQRGIMLNKLADLIEANKEEIAALESLDNGKPYAECLGGDLSLVIACFRHYAGWADKALDGLTNEISGPATGFGGRHTHHSYTIHQPVGVVGQIIPWNFPLLMLAWKLGPALATGCSVVMKTAEQTPLSALRVAELIREAGFPAGAVNILSGWGDKTTDGKFGPGSALSRHPNVDKVAFTGSTSIGQRIMIDAAETNLKRVTLELGGKSPNIVFADANLDAAVQGAHVGLFLNQGQCCCAGSRLFVEDSIYDKFIAASANAAQERAVGGAFTPGARQGPQVSDEQFDKVCELIESGKKQGAKVITGGGASKIGKGKGYFVEPTVFADCDPSMDIWNKEIFGPVMSVRRFKSMDEVVDLANDTEYGLAAGVWTNDANKIQHIVNNVRAGTVWVNCYDVFDMAAPFGGFKMSGIGRELGGYALRNYTEIKQVTQALFKTW
eukprot:TRINITY_DN44579_c0_g1_i1.p1 TRINITY_DN44579_c0_g1~~TRINITY_DN44579_c0_g1_i1.p1  ORF type:complete len:542 (+),score=201.93 TRINITY_DN44579_c0_g1_i1:66-1691(+)